MIGLKTKLLYEHLPVDGGLQTLKDKQDYPLPQSLVVVPYIDWVFQGQDQCLDTGQECADFTGKCGPIEAAQANICMLVNAFTHGVKNEL